MKSSSKKKFTLIELLIVIAIIGILMTILLPALSKAKDQAKSMHCINSLRQLCIATENYANDFNDYYPRANENNPVRPWFHEWSYFPVNYLNIKRGTGGDYCKNTLLDCPTQEKGYGNLSEDYSYNCTLSAVITSTWQETDPRYICVRRNIKRPSKLIMFADSLPTHYCFECWWGEYHDSFGYRHMKRVGIVLVDGHSTRASISQISYNSSNTDFNTRNP